MFVWLKQLWKNNSFNAGVNYKQDLRHGLKKNHFNVWCDYEMHMLTAFWYELKYTSLETKDEIKQKKTC